MDLNSNAGVDVLPLVIGQPFARNRATCKSKRFLGRALSSQVVEELEYEICGNDNPVEVVLSSSKDQDAISKSTRSDVDGTTSDNPSLISSAKTIILKGQP